MEPIRIQSVEAPFDSSSTARHAVQAISRAAGMGLLEGLEIRHLDLPSFRAVVGRISRAGIGREVQSALAVPTPPRVEELDRLLKILVTALEESPTPEHEWDSLEDVFGIERLAELLGTSTASVRRYHSGSRKTPDGIAARLHFLATLVGDLAGAYNEYGVRRWFERPRSVLGGRAPDQLLTGEWSPHDEDVQELRNLTRSLAGSPAT